MTDKEFPTLMLAHGYEQKRVDDFNHWFSDAKLDGIRVVAIVDDLKERVTFHTRNGRQLTMLSHLVDEILEMHSQVRKYDKRFRQGSMFDCEMVSNTGRFEDISGAIHRKDATVKEARLCCFHAMPLELFYEGKDDRKQFVRNDMVGEIIDERELELIVWRRPQSVDSHEDIMKTNAKFVEHGFEGSIVKNMHKPWEGKRSYYWLKIKEEETAEVIVVDLKKGKGKYAKTLGALICEYEGKKVQVSGMTDKQRRQFWKEPRLIIGKMIEVEYQNKTVHGVLRHPRFKRLRADKQGEKS